MIDLVALVRGILTLDDLVQRRTAGVLDVHKDRRDAGVQRREGRVGHKALLARHYSASAPRMAVESARQRLYAERRQPHIFRLWQAADADRADDFTVHDDRHAAAPAHVAQ